MEPSAVFFGVIAPGAEAPAPLVTVPPGTALLVRWQVVGADWVRIQQTRQAGGSLAVESTTVHPAGPEGMGEAQVRPLAPGTHQFQLQLGVGHTQAAARWSADASFDAAAIASAEPVVLDFSAQPVPDDGLPHAPASLQVEEGTQVRLAWRVAGADRLAISGVGAVDGPEGTALVTPPSGETRYQLTAEGPAGRARPRSVHVHTHAAGEVVSPHLYQHLAAPQILSFDAGGLAQVAAGDKLTVSWAVDGLCESIDLDPGVGDVTSLTADDGTGALQLDTALTPPDEDGTFTLTVAGPGGAGEASRELKVRVVDFAAWCDGDDEPAGPQPGAASPLLEGAFLLRWRIRGAFDQLRLRNTANGREVFVKELTAPIDGVWCGYAPVQLDESCATQDADGALTASFELCIDPAPDGAPPRVDLRAGPDQAVGALRDEASIELVSPLPGAREAGLRRKLGYLLPQDSVVDGAGGGWEDTRSNLQPGAPRILRFERPAPPKSLGDLPDDEIRNELQRSAIAFDGLGAGDRPAGRLAAYYDAIAPGESAQTRRGLGPEAACPNASSCGMAVRGLWELMGVTDAAFNFRPPYQTGKVIENLIAFAKSCGAWMRAEDGLARSGMERFPRLGDAVFLNMGTFTHVFTVVEARFIDDNHARLQSVDGGQFSGKDGDGSCKAILGVAGRDILVDAKAKTYYCGAHPVTGWANVVGLRYDQPLIRPRAVPGGLRQP